MLSKIHKTFTVLPKFRLIVDITSTCYYNVGSYLTELLNPLTQNEFIIRDSFDAANEIKSVPQEAFDDGYVFGSFDIESVYECATSVNYQYNFSVYNNKLLATKLKKGTLKKLIKDSCSKIVFSANNKLYQQIDGVSMGSSLGPLLGNITMIEMEKTIIKKFIDDKILSFYGHYVYDTLVVKKQESI